MDFASFGMAGVAAITVICYLAATAVKQTPLANKWLPSICGALGGLLGLAAMYINVPDFPAADPLTALAVGIVSGLAATGADQVMRDSTPCWARKTSARISMRRSDGPKK